MTLEELAKVAGYLVVGVDDDRSFKLKSMASAMDPTALYYRFLWKLAQTLKPAFSVEIGTYVGTSAVHMADGNPDGTVLTIDMNQDAKNIVDRLEIPNLIAVHDSSALAVKLLKMLPPIDVLFIDGNHCFNNCYGEYDLYRPFVRDGGVILFDDIDIDRQMETAWKYILDPKISLKSLHYTGFGAAIKDPSVSIPKWADIASKAAAEFAK